MTGDRLPLVPLALAFAAVHAALAVLGFDVMRWLLRGRAAALARVHAAFSSRSTSATDDPRYAVAPRLRLAGPAPHLGRLRDLRDGDVRRVAHARHEHRRLLPLHADARRDMRIGLVASALSAAAVTDVRRRLRGGGDRRDEPVRRGRRARRRATSLLVVLLVAIVVQGLAANITNVYTAGLSLVNTVPRLGRLWATVARRRRPRSSLSASRTSSTRRSAGSRTSATSRAPLTGVVLADYLLVKRQRIDVDGALRPARAATATCNGVNVAALSAIAAGVGVYYAVPSSWVKVVWGVGVGAAAYLALVACSTPHGAPTGAGDGVAVVTTATNEPTAPFRRITR